MLKRFFRRMMMGYGEIIIAVAFLFAAICVGMIIIRLYTGVWWKPAF